jgi:hypothetical protein
VQKTLYIPLDTTIDDTVECEKLIKRGDTLVLQLKIFTNGALSNLTDQAIDLILKKSDGTLIQKVITNISNGIITAILDLQATNVPGQVFGETQLTDSNGQISTNTFIFTVNESVANDVIVASKYDIQVLNDLRSAITDVENKITQYSAHVSAISNSIEAIEALINIKAYIDTNLPILQNENGEATANISNLDIKNTLAKTNIDTLTARNLEATNLINDLINNINIGNNSHNILEEDISNANYIMEQLKGSEWNYVLSLCQLYEKSLAGTDLTDENDIILTDENDAELTF